MADWGQIEKCADHYAESKDADVILLSGETERPLDHHFILTCTKRKRRQNVLLVLVTPGGNAHAAYRIARCLQRNWSKVVVFVPGWCKSAGTLLAIGAHELVMGDAGEFGPIDVQRPKQDELWASSSGLTEDAAIGSLEEASIKMFEHLVFEIKKISRGTVSFGVAAEVASSFTGALLGNVFAQIDPLKIGENSRAMNIAKDYGLRLGRISQNLSDASGSLETLVSSYSSHGFCIDREEARELFRNVTSPEEHSSDLQILCDLLGDHAYEPVEQGCFRFLNTEIVNATANDAIPQERKRPDDDAPSDSAEADGAAPRVSASNVASIREVPKS